MTTTNITNFRKNAFQYVEQTVKYNEPLNICTKDGNAVLLSEEDYSGIMETLYLVSVPGMREKRCRFLRAIRFPGNFYRENFMISHTLIWCECQMGSSHAI